MSEFKHYSNGHNEKNKDMENCGACVLLYSGEEGPNYSGWPLSFLRSGREIPAKYYKALIKETERTDNFPYVNNLKRKLEEHDYDIEAIKAGLK